MVRNIADIILVTPDNKILLQLRAFKKDVSGAGCWGLLGGSIEKEKSEQAIIREVKEEINYSIKKPVRMTIIIDSDEKNTYKHHLFYGLVSDKIEKQPLYEGKKIKLFTLSELKKLKLVPWFNTVYLPSILLLLQRRKHMI